MASVINKHDVSSIFRKDLFLNKVAIVTGGATGIGKAITKELLFLGCNVVIASRKLDRLQATASHVNEWLHKNRRSSILEYTQCNIRNEKDVGSEVDRVYSEKVWST
ncbi:hypothetical protein Btru_065483 [Bulinus truncatus]|nr:hypothetical protein Btru_065483 [Bulinus truncatus]